MHIHIPTPKLPANLTQIGMGALTLVVMAMLMLTLLTDKQLGVAAALLDDARKNVPACGDGSIDEGESCDDGNAWFGDGCTQCRVEAGYVCNGSPSACAAGATPMIDPNGASACGDGRIQEQEQCDDGNPVDGDGCSGACTWEAGYSCTGQPSRCAKSALAGEATAVESAVSSSSDASSSSSTATSSSSSSTSSTASTASTSSSSTSSTSSSSSSTTETQTAASTSSQSSSFPRIRPRNAETGYGISSASSSPQTMTAPVSECGDGAISGSEVCDDGNTHAGDGCSATCTVESGYRCRDIPSVCTVYCGDGVLSGQETCDDGNKLPGDGCDSACHTQFGYACTGAPSKCIVLSPEPGTSSSSASSSSSK